VKVYLLNGPYLPRFTRDMRWQDTGRGGTLYYPVWLAYATGMIEQLGIECRLVDCAARGWDNAAVLDDIENYGPDWVVLDTSFPSLNNDIDFAGLLKASMPSVKVVAVGAPASQFAERMLVSGHIDAVARWEFDFVLQDMFRNLRAGKPWRYVAGMSYCDGDRIVHNPARPFSRSEELDAAPFVSRVYKRHLRARDYMLNYSHSLHPEVQIFTARGCPNRCTFCSWPQTLTGRLYRARSVRNVLAEFAWIEKHYPEIRQVFIEDDTFTLHQHRVLEFCRLYREMGLRIPWGAQGRATLGIEALEAMREANCLMIDVGYESGSDDILRRVRKGITVQGIKGFAKRAREAGMSVHGNWIIGLPGETRETIEATKRLIRETKADAITVAVVTPFPGTVLYQELQAGGYLVTEDPGEYLDERGHQKSIVSYPWLSAEEIRRAVDDILKGYYLSWRYLPIALRRVFNRHGWNELKVLWRSAVAFLRYLRGR